MGNIVTQNALRLFGDGVWREYHDAIYQVGQTIPPNLAVREAERQHKRWYRSKYGPDAVAPPRKENLDTQVMLGRRNLARRVFLEGVSWQRAVVRETGQQIIRYRKVLVEPPPPPRWLEGKTIDIKVPSQGMPLSHRTIEEQRAHFEQRGERLRQRWFKTNGIDPNTYTTSRQQDEAASTKWQNMTKEERRQEYSRRAALSWETRRRNQQARKEETNG